MGNEHLIDFGELSKRWRSSAQLSTRALGKKIGVTGQQISRWETKKDRVPFHRLMQISKACGISPLVVKKITLSVSSEVDYASECQSLVKLIDQDELKALHTIMLKMIGL